MVCKEELCLWFKNLNPRKRIDYMSGLLHMCMPLELRFVGTVLENLGKKDYHYLREWEIKANNPAEVSKYKDLPAEYLRAKLMICLTLLHSSNTACGQAIFDAIESNSEAFGPSDDSRTTEDVLMILTLAVNHPAFLYEQHQRLNVLLAHLDNRRRENFRDNHSDEEASLDLCQDAAHVPYPSDEHFPVPPALCTRHSPAPQPHKVCICNIEVKSTRKPAEKKGGPEYIINATWSNGEVTEVYKKYREIQDFHQKLMNLFPEEKPKKQNGKIPSFPTGSPHQHPSREDFISEQIRSLNGFFKSLLGEIPGQILECDHMVSFFKGTLIRSPRLAPLPLSVPCQPVCSLPDASRMPRWPVPQYFTLGTSPYPRFMQSQPCPYQSPAHTHTLPQPSPTSSPPSPTSSVTSSPNNSQPASPSPHSTNPDNSLTQLLKLLGLEKYDDALKGYSVEQLTCMTPEELSNLGLPRDAEESLRSKLNQINSEKPGPINGLIDNLYPTAISASLASASLAWHSGLGYLQHHQGPPATSRSIFSVPESSLGLSYVPSPPASPSPVQTFTNSQGKLQTGDSSEGSEDVDREKSDNIADKGSLIQHGKTAQVIVPGGSGGGAGSPRPISTSSNLQMTLPDEPNKIPLLPSHPAPLQPLLPLIPHHSHLSTPNPAPGLLGQYVDPKADVGVMGMAAGTHNTNNNNNGYASDSGPMTSAGASQRHSLLHAGMGMSSIRGHFKGGQPQPAHTNMASMLQGKNLITMPADTHTAKPNSPVIQHVMQPYVGLRPPEIQAHIAQGLGSGSAPSPDISAPRVPLYVPYGRGQGAHMTSTMPPSHQGVLPHHSLVTRAGQTALVGSVASMTVSVSHPVTAVTASHTSVLTVTTTASHRSPSHTSGSSGQRESSADAGAVSNSVGGNDSSLRSSPSSGTAMGSASSPPSFQHVGCSVCEQQQRFMPTYPYQYWFPQPSNGIIPPPGMSSFTFAQGQHLGSSMHANGYTPEVYSYNPLAYASVSAGHFHPVFYGNSVYHGMQAQQNLPTPAASAGVGVVPQTLTAVGMTSVPVAQAQASSVSGKHRLVGCCNCGSLQHSPAACQENSMENMSGHYHLNYKVPPPRSDSD